jgi:hypothetical protein
MAAAESSSAAGMRKAPSLEWRWVSTEDDDREDGGGGDGAVGAVGRGGSFESEEDDDDEEEGKPKLIRTVPSVDWFDVEGNEVSVAPQLEDPEVRGTGDCLIAFRDGIYVRLEWQRLVADLFRWITRISVFVINQVGKRNVVLETLRMLAFLS